MFDFYLILQKIAIFLFKLFFDFKVFGEENIPEGGVIIASNHVSYLDPVILGASVYRRRIFYMAKEELFKIPILRNLIKYLGAFPVKRGSPDIKALKKALEILKENKILLIFPEGTRGDGKKLLPPKKGLGLLVSKSKVPVIPAYIFGTEKVLPKGAKFLKLNKIRVYFGKPIKDIQEKDYKTIGERVMEEILKLKEKAYAVYNC